MKKLTYLFEEGFKSAIRGFKTNLIIVVSFMLGMLLPYCSLSDSLVFINKSRGYTPVHSEELYEVAFNAVPLTSEEKNALQEELGCKAIGLKEYQFNLRVPEWENENAAFYGFNADYREFWDFTIKNGQSFTDKEFEGNANICMISEEFARKYHAEAGEAITLSDRKILIVGIFSCPQFSGGILPYNTLAEINKGVAYHHAYLWLNKAEVSEQDVRIAFKKIIPTSNSVSVTDVAKIKDEMSADVQKNMTERLVFCLVALIFAVINISAVLLGHMKQQRRTAAVKRAMGMKNSYLFWSSFAENISLVLIADAGMLILVHTLGTAVYPELTLAKSVVPAAFVVALSVIICVLFSFIFMQNMFRLPINQVLREEE